MTEREESAPKRKRRGRGRRIAADIQTGKRERFGPDTALAKILDVALAHRGDDGVSRATQRFHTYPARLHPNCARDLVEALPGKKLLDPFCGGGTVLVEGMLAGRTVTGSDISPVAELVAISRTRLLDSEARAAIKATGRTVSHKARRAAAERPRLPKGVHTLRSWYGPAPLNELGALSNLINDKRAPLSAMERVLLRAVHSSLVVKFSHRASDTSNKRQSIPRPKGAVLRAFDRRLDELIECLTLLREGAPEGTPEARVERRDVRKCATLGSFDLVLTSPPYPSTYDYVRLQQLRMAWLGREIASAEKGEIGPRRQFKAPGSNPLKKWQRDSDAWIRATAKALSPGGHAVIVIGDGLMTGRRIDARKVTVKGAELAGLELVAGATLGRNDHGFKRKKFEHAICFRKPLGESKS